MTYLDPYLSYIRLYVDWRTAVSFGVVLIVLLILAVAISTATKNRSN